VRHEQPARDARPDRDGNTVTGQPRSPIVIAGLPRSGTTWTMRVLGTSPGTVKILEPDNEDKFPAAIHAKHRLGRYPCLVPGQEAGPYRGLWAWILAGGRDDWRSHQARRILGAGTATRIFEGNMDLTTWFASTLARNPRVGDPGSDRVIAKSVHAQLSLEWIDRAFAITPLVLLRHPGNVLASWIELGLKDSRNSTLESRPEVRTRYVDRWSVALPGDDPIERMSWRIGLLIAALEEAVARNTGWQMRTHEQLCTDSVATFRTLFDDLGLEWGETTEQFLVENDQPGEGYVTTRVAADVVDSWQRRLDDHQLATMRRVLATFPITTWSDADYERTLPPADSPVG
jgi:hypothetical protein